jgi:hypothetical protein
MHEVALVELQFKTDAPPAVTLDGERVRETVGAGDAVVTLTVAVA